MKTTRLHGALLAAAASLALAACGGGSDNDPPANPNAPPASASASSQGFIAYIASLANGMFDNDEPKDLSQFTLPTDNVDNQPPAATPIDE